MKIEKKSSFTFSNLSEKEKKNVEIFEIVRKKGCISRTELSKITGINFVSISHYIKSYIDKLLILECGVDVSTGGRKPELIELNTKDTYIIGLDIGEGLIRAVLTDLTSKALEKAQAPCGLKDKDLAKKSADTIDELLKIADIAASKVAAIGVGISDDSFMPIGAALGKKFGTEVFTGTPASCAAFGEKLLNKAADADPVLYIHSDLGIGVVIIKDELFGARPPDGTAAERSRYLAPWDEMLGMVRNATEEVSRGVGTSIVNLAHAKVDNITTNVIIEAARQKDEVALAIVQNTGISLGLRIAYLVNLFSPRVVVVGGGPQEAGELILEKINSMVRKMAFAKEAKNVSIIPGCLGEDAVSLGASSLAIREMFLNA